MGITGLSAATLVPFGDFISNTMMVMITASTPSLNASMRPLFIPYLTSRLKCDCGPTSRVSADARTSGGPPVRDGGNQHLKTVGFRRELFVEEHRRDQDQNLRRRHRDPQHFAHLRPLQIE